MLPYAIAILVLVKLAGKFTTPTVLGVPYFSRNRDRR
jgi:ABC-type uncharacterized transport system permease subunit